MINELINAEAALSGAAEALRNGSAEDAAGMCTRCIERGEGVVPALLLRAECFLASGRTEDAMFDNGRAAALLSLSGRQRMEFAEDSIEAGMPLGYCADMLEKAGEEMLRHGEAAPADMLTDAANAYNRAGICRFRANAPVKLEKADFEKAGEIMRSVAEHREPTREDKLLLALISGNLAECHTRLGDNAEAKRLFNEASDLLSENIGNDPGRMQHYCICQTGLADIEREEGSNVEAHARLTRLIEMYAAQKGELNEMQRMNFSSCYNKRGTLRYQMGDYRGEIDDCTCSVKLREGLPDDPFALSTIFSNRAEAYEQLGEWREAAADYDTSAYILERTESNAPAGRGFALAVAATHRFAQGCCMEELSELTTAVGCYRKAADGFKNASALACGTEDSTVVSDDRMSDVIFENRYSVEQMIEMEALCRFRAGVGLCRTPERDYYGGLNEQLTAYELLGSLKVTPDLLAKKAVIAGSIGELYELFDDYDSAGRYFGEGEDMLERLNGSADDFVKALEQVLNANADGDGELSDETSTGDIIADTVAEPEDGFGSESLCDDGGDIDEYEEYIDDEDEIWEDSADDTPQG